MAHKQIIQALQRDIEIMEIATETLDILIDGSVTPEAKAKLVIVNHELQELLDEYRQQIDYLKLLAIKQATGAKIYDE